MGDVAHKVFIKKEKGRVVATLGVRSMEDEPLFVENYFVNGLREEVGFLWNVESRKIVEFSGLVSVGNDLGKLFFDVVDFFDDSFVFMVLSERLYRFLLKKGVDLVFLKEALPSGKIDKSRWGSYYDSKPVVVVLKPKHGCFS